MTPAMTREYKMRMEEFKLKLTELLEDYKVHMYVDDPEGYWIDNKVVGMHCKDEFDFDYTQPISTDGVKLI